MQSLQKPLVIPIFIPHAGCPHMCAFCNQSIITNTKNNLPDRQTIQNITNEYLNFKRNRSPIQLAFFGGNFLGLDPEYIVKVLSIAAELKQNNQIDSVRFSTRPDTISEKALDLIKKFPVSTIELGVQSMNDKVLSVSHRGHTSESTIYATSLLKKYEFSVGMQIMVGLPSDSNDSTLKSAHKILRLRPDFIRIYPLIVLNGSLIAEWFKSGDYVPLSLDECINLVKKLYMIFSDQNIPIIRMGLQASELLQDEESIIAGPWHPAFGHLVLSEIFFSKALEAINRKFSEINTKETITLKIHPASESKLRGHKNINIKRLKQLFTKTTFKIETNFLLNKESVIV